MKISNKKSYIYYLLQNQLLCCRDPKNNQLSPNKRFNQKRNNYSTVTSKIR